MTGFTFGRTPRLRRVEQHIVLPFYNHFRWGPAKERFAQRGLHGMLANDAAAAQQLEVAKNQLAWLDDLMVKQGNPEHICGPKFGPTICDVMLYTQLEFWNNANKGIIKNDWFPALKWVPKWFDKMNALPEAEESDQ